MYRNLLLMIAVYLLVPGCNDEVKKDIMPGLSSCDSAAIMYYHTPGNPRFYNLVKVYDKKLLAAVASDINGRVIPAKDTCTTQGKIYYYGKGDAVYIAYFSRAKECMTLSYIRTGEKYFVAMSGSVKNILDDWEKKAGEPSVATE
jgi:hypothetical protein